MDTRSRMATCGMYLSGGALVVAVVAALLGEDVTPWVVLMTAGVLLIAAALSSWW